MDTLDILRSIAGTRRIGALVSPKDRVRHVIEVTQRNWQLPVSRRKRAATTAAQPVRELATA
ncbi:MAG: hypothetical protein KBC94_02995 [Pseudacidovorax sp.]|uniref:hypothetical protein n=1 Tax=unclassified Pseudacidovorax TaxID=2620592 RepID=UPI001B4BD6D5|nr:hypothetical protein [Pseudacidovorax sp.]MBP6893364.1 hypothetical protein [Pseudacidovorax sp.]